MFETRHDTGQIERALTYRTYVQTVQPGSPEEREALARLDDVREDDLRSLRPDARDRARARHRRHWQRHYRGR